MLALLLGRPRLLGPPGCWVPLDARSSPVVGSTRAPTPAGGIAAALMPTMQSHKLFSPRVSFELAFASIAGEPQGYPSVLASKDACWPRRVLHRWVCLRQNQRVATHQGADSLWDA